MNMAGSRDLLRKPESSGEPLHAKIRGALEDRIRKSVYPVGSLIPTELDLAAEFEASRATVREALRYLSDRGYVERRQGIGTRVASNTPRGSYSQSFESLEELFQVSHNSYFLVHAINSVMLDSELAERVGGAIDEEWFCISGVRWTEPGEKPLSYVDAFVPKRFEHLLPTMRHYQGPFFHLLEQESGDIIEETVQEIRALPMPAEIGRQLGLRPAAIALQLLRRYVTRNGVLIASFNWHPSHEMKYVMRICRRSATADA